MKEERGKCEDQSNRDYLRILEEASASFSLRRINLYNNHFWPQKTNVCFFSRKALSTLFIPSSSAPGTKAEFKISSILNLIFLTQHRRYYKDYGGSLQRSRTDEYDVIALNCQRLLKKV